MKCHEYRYSQEDDTLYEYVYGKNLDGTITKSQRPYKGHNLTLYKFGDLLLENKWFSIDDNVISYSKGVNIYYVKYIDPVGDIQGQTKVSSKRLFVQEPEEIQVNYNNGVNYFLMYERPTTDLKSYIYTYISKRRKRFPDEVPTVPETLKYTMKGPICYVLLPEGWTECKYYHKTTNRDESLSRRAFLVYRKYEKTNNVEFVDYKDVENVIDIKIRVSPSGK